MSEMPTIVSDANQAEVVAAGVGRTATSWPPGLPAQSRSILSGFGLFALVTFSTWLSIKLSQHSGGIATIWLSNGMVLALVLRRPRRVWPLVCALELSADILGSVLCGNGFGSSIVTGLCNSVEIFLAAALLVRFFGTPFPLSRPKPLLAFLAIAVVTVPLATSALATTWYWWLDGSRFLTAYRTWYLGDALGIAMMAPFVFILQEPEFLTLLERRNLLKTLLVLTVPAIGALLDFGQTSEVIVLFLIPSLLFVVFRLGFPGAVLGISVAASISIALTVSNHGPYSLVPGLTTIHRLVLVQVLLAGALLTAFPVAALIEQQRRLEHSLHESELRYRTLANTDPLTGQANRRAFEERLEQEWAHCGAELRPFTLLAIDVDKFKAYNDIYGHIAGDDCLRHIAGVAAEALHVRTSARLYRLGGEEFAVLLPNCDPGEALALAERIRLAVQATGIVHAGADLRIQTVSIGVATMVPDPAREPLSLLDQADRALYRAKENGRNRCEVA